MLIVALVLAVIGLAALVTAVVTSNELVAWVCIAASVLGVILLIVDAIRERQSRACRRGRSPRRPTPAGRTGNRRPPPTIIAYSDRGAGRFDVLDVRRRLSRRVAGARSPPRITPRSWSPTIPSPTPRDDDEPELPEPAEEAALHTVDENEPPVDEVDDLDAEADEPDKR